MLIRFTALTLATSLVAAPAFAAANLVTNGDFEQTTLTSSGQFTTQVTGWTNATTSGYTGYGYNFLILPGTADTTGFTSLGNNHDYLWGPGNGTGSSNYSNNGLTATSPTGGNYIASDGDPNFAGAISQTITGLTIGTVYSLTFYWAAAQFASFSGATTEAWKVTFGNASQTTTTDQNASHGFVPWTLATMTFEATSTSQVLSFLAQGSPSGQPPTSLLDGVSLVAAPEPATWAILATGVLALGAATRRRKST